MAAFIIPRGPRACAEIVLPPGPARPVPKPCIICRILYGWEGDGCPCPMRDLSHRGRPKEPPCTASASSG